MSREPGLPPYRASVGERLEVDVASTSSPAATAHARQKTGSAHLVFPNLLDAICSLLSFIVVALFVLTFVIQPFRIPSESMERTLLVGDFLLVNKSIFGPPGHWGWLLPYQPVNRGDIIVFHLPRIAPEDLVKRVIGLPGDHLQIRNGEVYVNGQKQNAPFAIFEGTSQNGSHDPFPFALYTDPGVDTQWWTEMQSRVQDGQLVVPANAYFVMGDNRNHSRDSRYWGFVPSRNIEGRPFMIYFSLHQPSTTDAMTLPDDRLGHENDPLETVVGFARWNRIFRVVR